MTAPDPGCSHPFDRLRVDSGRSGERGQAGVYRVVCDACKKAFPDSLGLRRVVESAVADNELVWRAVLDLGGRRKALAPPKVVGADKAQASCEHYLSWLHVDPGGAGQRGYSGSVWIRCRGCKVKWPESVGLGVFLQRLVEDRRELADAIRRLGGRVTEEAR